jgi:SpoVK/Ycf46/Vps4 family AAA+-type ATPase
MADKKTISPYADNTAHLDDELRKLDLLIRRQLTALKQGTEKMREITLDPHLYVSREEVDHLLRPAEPPQYKGQPSKFEQDRVSREIDALQCEINARTAASIETGVFLALPELALLFDLSPFEVQTLVICLAPELHRKYDKVFVYLQDDIARKKPSIDLVLNLLCEADAERWKARGIFSLHAPLLRSGILQVVDDHTSPSASSDLARFLTVDPRILDYLLGNTGIDKRLADSAQLFLSPVSMDDVLLDTAVKNRILNIVLGHLDPAKPRGKKLVLHLYGPRGVGKRDLALGICRKLGCFLLYLDIELVMAKEAEAGTLLRLAFREGVLQQAVIYIDHIDALASSNDTRSKALLKLLARMIAEYGWLTVLAGEKPWPAEGMFETAVFLSTHLDVPAPELRQIAWEKVLQRMGLQHSRSWAAEMAAQFRLTPGQILDAAQYADYHYQIGEGKKSITLNHLYAAGRSQSNQKLTELAAKIEPAYGWNDIVLAEEKIIHLKEICSQVKHYHRVFGEWGFGKKISHGKGLSVLFSGTPGTGKTMTAQVMARELQLDLYKIDLSGVVSKYIGETEKNLARIFYEAETSNAILFFDEADALFGKRTEVSDAHDRYANIETSFLLQKMEEYEGVVILATNFRSNMDEAFTRRIRFIVEFPFPDEESRCRIWKTHFPPEAPVSKEIDYRLLARQFQVSGGNIRNIVLNAAFIAAQNGGTIEMEHIYNGARREFEKIGKLWDKNENIAEKRRVKK